MPETFRPATLEELVKPRTAPVAHVVRTGFPQARREAGAGAREAVRAWAEANGLGAQLERFVAHEYEFAPGIWVPFLEWRDYRQELKPGEPVRVYLHDIARRGASPLMFAVYVHAGWSQDLSALEEQLLHAFTLRNPFPQEELGALAERYGVSRTRLEATLASMLARQLIYRGGLDDRLRPGTFILVKISGSFAQQKTTQSGILSRLRLEEAARERMKVIKACLAERGKSGGFPQSLAQLAPGCLDAKVASGMTDGYRYAYFPAPADRTGRIAAFSVCAEPVLPIVTGVNTYGIDEHEDRISDSPAAQPFNRPAPCARVLRRTNTWSFGSIKHCLVAYAARNPALGYPADLTPIGPAGDGCLLSLAKANEIRAQTVEVNDRQYRYVPGPREADGRIVSYELRSEAHFINAPVEDLLTEDGVLHSADWRAARRDDPPPEAVRERVAKRYRAREEGWKAAGERCAKGSMPDCGEYAHYEWIRGTRDNSYPLWDQACAAGVAESCLFSRKFLGEIRARWQNACKQREPLGCETWEQHRLVFEDSITLKRECEREVKTSCARLAEMAAQLRTGGRLLPPPKPQP